MIDTLVEKIKEKTAPVCVGLHPVADFIPEHIKEKAFGKKGQNAEALAEAFLEFNKRIIDCVYDLVPAVKPQIAMYEELGVSGIDAYIRTCAYAKNKGLVVIGDVKRGDIGSTSRAYANAHIGKVNIEGKEISTFDADFATVNPYMGSDGIDEFLKCCSEYDKGIFVLVKTSNPSSAELQDLKVGDDTIYEIVAKKVNEWGSGLKGRSGYSRVGAVVGATYPEIGKKLRKLMPDTYFLVPGYGAQGASGKDLKEYFNVDGLGAVINSSRGIIAAYKKDEYSSFGEEAFGDAARQATVDMIKDLRDHCTGN